MALPELLLIHVLLDESWAVLVVVHLQLSLVQKQLEEKDDGNRRDPCVEPVGLVLKFEFSRILGKDQSIFIIHLLINKYNI